MAKAPKDEDPEESRRFVEKARELEADGDLNLTDAEKALERVVGKILPPLRRGPQE